MSDPRQLFVDAARRAAEHRSAGRETHVFPAPGAVEHVRGALGALADEPREPEAVIEELAAAVEPALVVTTGPRYFGFVVGGALDAASAADILTTGWDQNAFTASLSPAATIVEEVAGAWLKELLGLPANASFGFVTGGQAANTVALAAARHHVLATAGWNVERDGLVGGPAIRVIANQERHATIDRALRLLGIGTSSVEPVATGPDGAIDVDALRDTLAGGPAGPCIVCLQAGNVNSGAFDDFPAAIAAARARGAWVHVDGAFGLWAAANPATARLVRGVDAADSWATDGHKWLNVPYDCGYVFCAHPDAHLASMAFTAAYLTGHGAGALRAPGDYVPESSRRARGFATWAALRELGRRGVADLVERCCALARRFAEQLDALEGVSVVNEAVLNQVLVSFGSDERTDRVVELVQESGECWMGATTWHGRRLMRISVSNWRTTDADVDRSVRAIASALAKS